MAVTVWVSCFVLYLPEVSFPGEQSEKACRKDETRTDEGCVKNPRVTHRTAPVYPSEAKSHGVEGHVILQVRLTKGGEIDTLEVIEAKATDSHYAPMFSHAATEAVRKWSFSPGTLNGKPRAVTFTERVDFQLKH
jgi:TonB family protein